MDFRKLGLGFLAGCLAVLTAHQLTVYGLSAAGLISAQAWSKEPAGLFGVPAVLNSTFWGGVWGSIFALSADRLPGGSLWSKGLVFGLIFPLVIGAWLIVHLSRACRFSLVSRHPGCLPVR